MVSLTKQQWNEIWKTIRNGLISFTCLPLFHRMPCFQRDFGKRTRPLNLPRALSTENACCRTWRSKHLSTRTEKTLYHLQGKRKVPSVFARVLSTGLPEHPRPPLPGLFVPHAGTKAVGAVTAQGEAQESDARAAVAGGDGRPALLLCSSNRVFKSGLVWAWEHVNTSAAKGSVSSSQISKCPYLQPRRDRVALPTTLGLSPPLVSVPYKCTEVGEVFRRKRIKCLSD